MKLSTRVVRHWDLAPCKPEPITEAEAVVTFLYYLQVIAPYVWDDLIERARVASTQGDLARVVAAWAMEWRLCGPSGPTEWAVLIGVATAKVMLAVPRVHVPTGRDFLIPIFAEHASSPSIHRRIASAARRLLISRDTAKSMCFASAPVPDDRSEPGEASDSIPILIFRKSPPDPISTPRFFRWCLTLYRRRIRKGCTAFKLQHPQVTHSTRITANLAATWDDSATETDPSVNELLDKIIRAVGEQVRQHDHGCVPPTVFEQRPAIPRNRTRNVIWFIRYQIVKESATKIGQHANKFIENEPGDHPASCDRGTVVRGIRLAAQELGVVPRTTDRGGRPPGKKDSWPRRREKKSESHNPETLV